MATRTRASSEETKARRGKPEAAEAPPEAPEAPPEVTLTREEIEAQVRAEVGGAYEEAMTAPERLAPEWAAPEVAEVQGWWDIAAFGPIQPIAPGGALTPSSVIKVGESAFVFAIILLNPFIPLPGGTNPAEVLSNFALPYEVQYQTGNLTTWTLGQPDMQGIDAGNLSPGPPFFYFEVIGFVAAQPGLYEMNITARLLGAAAPFVDAPRFGARATTVFNLDPAGLFGAAPPYPLRFNIYA